MIRTGTVALLISIWMTDAFSSSAAVRAQSSAPGVRLAQAAPEQPVPPRLQRPPARLRVYPRYDYWPDDVYPRYDPGPNAVRECNATYVQEFRPSGTVIVPRMHCWWRPG
jgi:hypothetical protein